MARHILELEQELSRLRSCVNLTEEQAGQVRQALNWGEKELRGTRYTMGYEMFAKALTLLSTPQPPVKEQS